MKSLLLSLVGGLLLMTSSCSKDDKNESPNPDSDKKGIQVREDTSFGSILTDKDGRTLYFFSTDAGNTSTCVDGCATIWPIYYSADASTDLGINSEDVGEITRADGSKQSTYKGWPLYYYASDTQNGDIKGDGVGGIWFVAKPDYVLMVVSNQLVGADGTHYQADLNEGDGATTYFTDDRGRTLYAFTPDKSNTNTFTKEDFSNDAIWPIYQTSPGAIPSIIDSKYLTSITVFGKTQLTYKGWPLYYFGQDASRGDNKGVNVPQPGVWPVVNLQTAPAPNN